MKKGEIYEGTVVRIDFPNRGIIELDGEVAVVKNALPGQRVTFGVTKKRKGKCEGRLLEVTAPAADETAADPCPHFGVCGGCLYQTFPYERQLAIKEAQVRALLDPVVRGPFQYDGILKSPLEQGYRNKMEFSFGDEYKGGPLALGMHRRGSLYDIVTADGCRIVHEDFRKILSCTREYFAEKQVPFLGKRDHLGYLRHLLVRRATKTGEILTDLITTTQTDALPGGLSEQELLSGWVSRLGALKLEGTLAGILHTRNDTLADAVKDEGTDILAGRGYFYEELLGLRFRITPFSFFQTNSLGAELLYEKVREYVGSTEGKTVFDLYSGTGTIAQILAPVASRVVGVEIVEEAVEAARKNARANGLANCEFLAGDVLKVVDGLTQKPDLIVLDPPRDGIHPKAIGKIIRFGVGRMVYVSCKPTSLARDLEILQESGYRVERLCLVDLFPATANVETVCLLSQRKPDTTIEVDLDISELEVSSAETKATYEEIKSYVLKKFGLKVSNLYIAQVKRECGIVERINYNLPKTEGNRVPQCPEDKRKAIKDAFIHFQMI